MVVRAGHIKIKGNIDTHQNVKIARVVVHEKYNKDNLFNDIAIVFLEDDFVMSKTVSYICVPDQDFQFTGQSCVVSGFGKFLYFSE